jgi:uncharacterized protein
MNAPLPEAPGQPDDAPSPAAREAAALEALAARLQGFGSSIQAEWLDGALTAVAAGAYQLPLQNWMGPLLGEEFERAYADPADVAQAEAAVSARLAQLRRMLDGEALLDQPDLLRLEPLLYSWGDGSELPEGLAAEPDAQALLQGGALWAEGFLWAVTLFPDVWAEPDDPAARDMLAELLGDIEALLKPTPDDAPVPPPVGDEPPMSPREAAIDRALFAAQDLRVFWLDFAPRPPPRRVEAQPGRNDPCPCGSGRKFKKCHGASA